MPRSAARCPTSTPEADGAPADVLAAFDALFVAATVDRDPDAVVAMFVDGAIWFAGSDLHEHATSREGLRAIMATLAASSTRLHFEWASRQAHASADVAWVNAAGRVAITAAEGETSVPYRVTAVLVRRAGRWRWQTFAGSIPD